MENRPDIANNLPEPAELNQSVASSASDANSVGSNFLELFSQTDMPLWLSLLFACAAALGTYYFAPKITRRLEIGKARSGHVLSAIYDLNSVVVSLNKKIRNFMYSFRLEDQKTEFYRAEILDIITELHWRIIDLKVILKKAADIQLLDGFGEKVESLRTEVVSIEDGGGQEILLTKVSDVSHDLKLILDRLYREADLK